MIEQAKCTYYPLRKTFKKHQKSIKDHGIKQVEAIWTLIPINQQLQKTIGNSRRSKKWTSREWKKKKIFKK